MYKYVSIAVSSIWVKISRIGCSRGQAAMGVSAGENVDQMVSEVSANLSHSVIKTYE